MFTISEDQIQQDYNKFFELLKNDPRLEQLKIMYKVFGDRFITAPAAGKVHYHNCFVGGYINHVVRVAEVALKIAGLYKLVGGDTNFDKQEVIFAALHHDLGKLGSETQPYYLDQESDWHRKRGELFKHNDQLSYMTPPDRALMLLQKYNIVVTENEWLAIKLSDGLYDEGNKSYYKNFQPYPLKTNLPYIIHMADLMSCRIENDMTRFIDI